VRRAHQPKKDMVKRWLMAALTKQYQQICIDILIVSAATSQQYNSQQRKIDKPTNVIALEYPDSRDQFAILTGELILCDTIIVAEAEAQNKSILDHYAHLLVHGMLHLQGLDHQHAPDAEKMERLEIEILQGLGVANPYVELDAVS